MDQYFLSVIIPVYNVEKYLRRCVDSVLNQHREDIKVILVDDGSTDRSSEICDEYARKNSNVQVFHKQNGGLSSARNFALRFAEGQYVYYLDSDDALVETFFEEIIPYLKRDGLDILEFKFCFERKLGCFKPKGTKKYELTGKTKSIEKLLKNMTGNQICFRIYNRSLFENIRFPEGRDYEDIATFYRLMLKSQKVGYIDYEYYIYNLTRDDSITKSVRRKSMEDMYLSVNEMCSSLKEYCRYNQLDLMYLEYYRRNTYIYIYFKLIQCRENVEDFKEELKDYLRKNNQYNLWKYRYYDVRKMLVFKILSIMKLI